MDQRSILSKTAKGLAEATGKTSQLARALRNLLKGIDGRTPIVDLAEKFSKLPEAELLETLQVLEQDGFVRELPRADAAVAECAATRGSMQISATDEGEDLDFTVVAASPAAQPADNVAARREAAEHAEAEAIARARAEGEAVARAQAEAEAAAKAKADAEAAANAEAKRAEAAVLVRVHHEAKTKQAADARAKAEAEAAELRRGLEEERKAREELERRAKDDVERAVREAQEWARKETEERARREAEEIARRQAEEQARREAEELRAKLEAERKAKEDAERAMREAEERARREAEERAQREDAERAGREAEVRETRERLEAEESASRQAMEQARRESEELRAKLEAERKAREDAERRAREESQPRPLESLDFVTVTITEPAVDEAQVKRAEEEGAKAVALSLQVEQAKRAAERQAQEEEAERKRAAKEAVLREEARVADEAKQKRLREEEERRRVAEEEERRREEEQARTRAETLAKVRAVADAAMRAREQAARDEALATERQGQVHKERRRKAEPAPRMPLRARRGVRIAAVLVLLVVGAFATAYFMPLDVGSFERAATARLGTPVKIGSAHLVLLPMPTLRFERVSIGPAGDVKIAAVSSRAGVGAIFDRENALKTLELDGVQIPASWLGDAIWGKSSSDALGVERVIARGVKVEAPGLVLPVLNVDAKLDPRGALHSLSAQTADGKQTFDLTMTNGKAGVQISARPFQLPFPGAVQLGDLVGGGTLTASGLTLNKFDLAAFGGFVQGNARVRWGESWSVEGEFVAASMNPRLATASLVSTGRLEGKGTFSMRAQTPEKLHEAARIDATFTVKNGTLGFVDLARMLQGGNARGGTTSFGTLDGNVSFGAGTVRLTQLRLAAGLLNATGNAAVDPASNLSGRLQVDLTSQARGVLTLGGTAVEPHVKR